MVRFVLDDDKVYKVVAESDDAIWVIDYDNPCAPKMVKQDGLVNLEEIPVPDDYMQESVVSRAIYDTAKKRLGILSAILSDNAYLELPTVDGPYWQIVEDRLSSKNLEVYHKDGEENWTTAIFSGHTVYDYVADDGSLQKCIISGYEVFDLNNASDEIEYPNDTTQLRKETTCERIYIYNNQDEYDAAVKNREEGQAILNGEEVAPERCVILNGSIVPNLQYEVGDDGKIRISMRDLANAYSSKTIYIEENHILYVPMVYQYTAKFPTKDTPQSVLDNLNISEVVNPDDDTFTYTSTISMDLWNDTFELPQDDTYMMPIEHISRILGWEFWTGDNVLKIVSDELDDTNPDNFVIDTTVREETCYDVGTGEEIACD